MGYYRRLLEHRDLRLRLDFMPQVQLLDDSSPCRTYHVGFGRSGGGHLFYVYPFGQGEAARGRASFLDAQAALRSAAVGVDVERLLLAEDTERAGYILTGTSDLPPGLRDFCQVLHASPSLAELPSLADHEVPSHRPSRVEAPGQTAYEEGLIAVQDERLEDAVTHFVTSVEANPYHRESYLLLLALLDGAGRYDEAALYGDLAERNLPDDGLVAYRQGIAAVRRADLDAAIAYFDRAALLAGTLYQPHFFGAHVLLVRGGLLEDVASRLERAVHLADARPEVEACLRAVQRCISLRRSLRAIALLAGLLSLVAVFTLSPYAALPLFLAGGLGLVSGPFSEALARLLAGRCFEEPA
jgi:tetratricopeptide (TPR) repeat protein